MGDRVTLSLEAGVADVRLTRADKLNAIDDEMVAELIDVAQGLMTDRAVRAVVVSGEGRAFSSGRDAGVLGGGRPPPAPRQWRGVEVRASQMAMRLWEDIPVPVIAAVHGMALGGGLHLALGADIRIVSPDCRLAFMEVDWGMVPDMGGTEVALRLLGEQVFAEMVFTGRQFSGEEAVARGLALKAVDDPVQAARELASQIAGKSPDSIRAAKRLLREVRQSDTAGALLAESRAVTAIRGKPNQAEAALARREKRPPQFVDSILD